jgi:hypothetical protein
MWLADAGLIPISPTIEVVPVVVIAVSARTAKPTAVPRFTAGTAIAVVANEDKRRTEMFDRRLKKITAESIIVGLPGILALMSL